MPYGIELVIVVAWWRRSSVGNIDEGMRQCGGGCGGSDKGVVYVCMYMYVVVQ